MEEEFGSQQGRAIIDSTVKMAPTNIQAQVEQKEQSQATNELAEDGVEDKQKTQDYAVDVNQIEAIGGSLPTNGSPKEETDNQEPRAEDLALNVATGRQSRRARRQGGPRNEAMAKKAAEILGTTNKIQATKVEVGIAEEMESFEDKLQEESDDSERKESSRPSLESSLFREPSQFMIAAQVPTPPILPALPSIHPHSKNNNVASTPMNTGVPSDPKAELFRQRAGHSSVFSDPTSPGAVPALGRAFGAWERPNARPTTAPLSMAADGIVTAETVDEEAVVYAEDVQWDNRARNKRMIIICALIALLVVVLVSVIIYVMNSEDDNDRCSKDHGEINIVVHCKCFNTAEFYIQTLDDDELDFYQQFVNHPVAGIPEEMEMNSCLPRNQAVLEVAAVNRNGLNASKATEVIDRFSLDDLLFEDVFGIVLFYILMDGDNWEKQDNWLQTFDYCLYHGVRCTFAGRISSIALPRNGLAGTLPVETTGMMRNLYVLNLSDNEGIHGTLPTEITGNLTKLRTYKEDDRWSDLSYRLSIDLIFFVLFCFFDILLDELNLDSIGLSGTIPENIGNLKHLSKYSISLQCVGVSYLFSVNDHVKLCANV